MIHILLFSRYTTPRPLPGSNPARLPCSILSTVRSPHQYLAGSRAIGRANNTFTFHNLNHACRPVVTNAQTTLHHGNGGLPGFSDNGHSFVVFLVILGFPLIGACRFLLRYLQYALVIFGGALLLQAGDQSLCFLYGDMGSMVPLQFCGPWRQKQHIPHAQQVFGTGTVENGA